MIARLADICRSTVLPWHDPLRVAERWSWLDHVSNGRAILGLGRGLGHVEFDAFRLNMAESRQRFVEHAEATLAALATGYMEYEGALFSQPPAAIRPFPAFSFRGRVYASAVSPESIEIMARDGRRDLDHRPEAVGDHLERARDGSQHVSRDQRCGAPRSRCW
jgi:alkanesulfonate monooxygenase SsuD/methylene tetrahydromethanopterin reductase-like flavin-dependent oxidoreductase (luciferase family)